jgi:hypothetical protein
MSITLSGISHPLFPLAVSHYDKAAQSSPTFHFAVSRGPRVLVQIIAVHIRFLLIIFKVGAGNSFFLLADTRFYHVGHYT